MSFMRIKPLCDVCGSYRHAGFCATERLTRHSTVQREQGGGKSTTFSAYAFEANPEVPSGEVWVVQNGKVVQRITGLADA
jgi:hypothetical protein